MDCVAQLGGLHEAQATLRRRMPRQLAAVISRALDSFPASQRLPPGQYDQEQQRSAGAAGSAGLGDDISVPPAVAGTAQALLEHVLGACLQVWDVGRSGRQERWLGLPAARLPLPPIRPPPT